MVFCSLIRTFAVVIELQRHIEILLLDNDCVIVPDFGGFVAHRVASRYDQDDHMLLPPMRTLGFNPQLRINDSLLVQSYINALDISYPEALRRVESEVNEMKQVLSEEGFFTLEDIGTLRVNSDGNIKFEPCEAGILSPEYYGLNVCHFPTLKETREARLAGNAVQVPIETVESEEAKTPTLIEFIDNGEEKEEFAIKVKLSWIRNAVAVAAAVVAFFLMATPIANSDLDTTAMSNLQGQLLTKLMPKDTNMALAKPVVEEKKISENSENVENPEASETPTAQPATTYCIVLASQVKLSNAELYVEQLKARGMAETEVYIHNHTVRVIYGSFESESEAYRHLNKLNKKDEFAEAWVYKKTESQQSAI